MGRTVKRQRLLDAEARCANHRDQPRLPGKTICQKCRENFRAYANARIARGMCATHPTVPAMVGKTRCESCYGYMRRRRYARVYGITVEEYDALLEKQGGLCAICRQPETSQHPGKKVNLLAIDHDHITKKLRGLLCGNCNRALGLLKEDVHLFLAAIEYLQHHRHAQCGTPTRPQNDGERLVRS